MGKTCCKNSSSKLTAVCWEQKKTDYWQWLKNPKKIFDTWSISKDKSQNELNVVESLFETLSMETSSLKRVMQNDPPDCVFELNGTKVGVEVIGLIDEKARSLSAKSRRNNSNEYYAGAHSIFNCNRC